MKNHLNTFTIHLQVQGFFIEMKQALHFNKTFFTDFEASSTLHIFLN